MLVTPRHPLLSECALVNVASISMVNRSGAPSYRPETPERPATIPAGHARTLGVPERQSPESGSRPDHAFFVAIALVRSTPARAVKALVPSGGSVAPLPGGAGARGGRQGLSQRVRLGKRGRRAGGRLSAVGCAERTRCRSRDSALAAGGAGHGDRSRPSAEPIRSLISRDTSQANQCRAPAPLFGVIRESWVRPGSGSPSRRSAAQRCTGGCTRTRPAGRTHRCG